MTANAFGFDDRQQKSTPEAVLLDTADRVGRIREGRACVHLHLSDLQPQNRSEGHVRITARLFETMADSFTGQMFVLSNSDIILLCKDARIADLDAVVFKLRALFSKDPLTYTYGPDDEDRFATYYDLEVEYDQFFELCQRLNEQAKQRNKDMLSKPPVKDLDAASLGQVIARIGQTDIASVVRRQPCVYINDRRIAQVVFQEFYMSIFDLQKQLSPDVNLLSNRWLFQHLSQALDLSVMSNLQQTSLQVPPVAYSLNLNMSSVETQEFRNFVNAVKAHSGVYVEFQMSDVFNNMDQFFRVRDELRSQNINTVLDGLNALMLQFIDVEHYDLDFVKVNWSNDFVTDIQSVELHQALAPYGYDRVILARCDNEDAIKWGLDRGIRLYQGRFMDTMVAAFTMAKCPQAAPCTLSQCTQRHAVISGRPRAECGNNEMLDEFPPLHAIS